MSTRKDLAARAEKILKSRYITKIDEIPAFMTAQKQLCEFARDAAKFIIASQQADSAEQHD